MCPLILDSPVDLRRGLKCVAHVYAVSVSNHRRLYDGWVCGLAQRLRYVTFLEKMMNCSCKVDWEHSFLVSNRVFVLYFDCVMNYYLFTRSIWWKFYDNSPMFNFVVVIIINMMLLELEGPTKDRPAYWNAFLMCMRWVLAIIEDYMMVEYVDLPKGSDTWPFLKRWWIVVAKLTENIVFWFLIEVMLYTSIVQWIVTYSWEVYDESSMIRV